MTADTETATGPFRLRIKVPADMVSFAVDEDDAAAAETHAAFVDSWLPSSAPPGTRDDMLTQLAAARRYLRRNGTSWFGMTASPLGGRWAMVLISVHVTPFDSPTGVSVSDTLARMLAEQYPADAALIETFHAPKDPAVGVRRLDSIELPGRTLTIGVSQALVVFDPPGALGIVTSLCLNTDDIDLATVLVAGIARSMRVTSAEAA